MTQLILPGGTLKEEHILPGTWTAVESAVLQEHGVVLQAREGKDIIQLRLMRDNDAIVGATIILQPSGLEYMDIKFVPRHNGKIYHANLAQARSLLRVNQPEVILSF